MECIEATHGIRKYKRGEFDCIGSLLLSQQGQSIIRYLHMYQTTFQHFPPPCLNNVYSPHYVGYSKPGKKQPLEPKIGLIITCQTNAKCRNSSIGNVT